MRTMEFGTQAPAAAPLDDSPLGPVMRALTWAVLGITLLVWAVVGFLFWIPLLIRATVLFSVRLVHATLTSQSAERAGERLKDAINFWLRGFIVAIDAVGRSSGDDSDAPPERAVNVGYLLNELAWAGLAWYALLLMTGAVQTSPLDVWRAAAALPWLDTLSSSSIAFADWARTAVSQLSGR
jgi:hypothetical protein